ncbi:MAG TPA: hypothetical protein V6D25_02225 [Leptolyngbyaceae cyanobacterium]
MSSENPARKPFQSQKCDRRNRKLVSDRSRAVWTCWLDWRNKAGDVTPKRCDYI